MKKLLAMFAILATIGFVACSDKDEPQAGPTGEPELKLTSESVMNYTSEGGKGTITYSLKNKVDGVELSAKATAAWIENVATGAAVTFSVLPNEGEDAREASIVVEYGDQNFSVTIKQAGVKGFDQDVELTVLQAQYWSDFEEYGIYNYQIYISNSGVSFSSQGVSVEPSDTIYSLDLYSDVAPADPMSIPVGTYAFDASNSCEAGTMGAEYSFYAETNAEGSVVENPYFTAGTVVVSEGRIEATLTLDNGELHHVVYEGSLVVEEEEPVEQVWSNLAGDVAFESVEVTAESTNYGDYYEVGMDNYTIELNSATHGMNLELLIPTGAAIDGDYEFLVGNEVYPSKYYVLPGDVVENEGKLYTVSTWYLNTATEEMGPVKSGSLNIATADGVVTYTVDVVDDAGNSIKGSFVAPAEGGGDEPTPGTPISNVAGDVTFEDVNAVQQIVSHGDALEIGMNIYVGRVLSDTHSMTFQVMTPVDAENLEGIYEILPTDVQQLDRSKYYFQAGVVQGTSIAATWYLNNETAEMGPIVGGTIEIQVWASGYTFYDVNVVDDAGNTIKGTFLAEDDTPGGTGEGIAFDVEGGMVFLEDYDDDYGNGLNNWVVTLVPAEGNGMAAMLEIFTPLDAETIAGTYTMHDVDNPQPYTFIPGYADYAMAGSFAMSVTEMEADGSIFASLEDGAFSIQQLEDGAYVVTFECVDENGNTITGTYHGYDPNAGAESKIKPQISSLKSLKKKVTMAQPAAILKSAKQAVKTQQTKELMPLNIQKGKKSALIVK